MSNARHLALATPRTEFEESLFELHNFLGFEVTRRRLVPLKPKGLCLPIKLK